MFRIKNVRNSTVAKQTNVGIALPSHQKTKIPIRRFQMKQTIKKTVYDDKKQSKLRDETSQKQNKLLNNKPIIGLNQKRKLIITKNSHSIVPEIRKSEIQSKELQSKVIGLEDIKHQVISTDKIERKQSQNKSISRKFIQKQENSNQSPQKTYQSVKGKELDIQKVYQQQDKQKNIDILPNQRQEKEKSCTQKANSLQVNIQHIMARRKARQQQKQRKLKIENERKLAQQLVRQSLKKENNQAVGIINLTDNLCHVEMSEAIMDVQIQMIIKTKFTNFRNKTAIELQIEQLSRINDSFLMIRDELNHPLVSGLRNYRIQIFNRIGQLIMQEQQLGSNHPNFVIINSNNHNNFNNIKIRRGLTIEELKKIVKETRCLEGECAICLGNIGSGQMIYELQCGHQFHQHCLQDWIQSSANCPTCRFNIKFGHQ